jgi:F-type H+-transporting ATPase subunit a
MTGDHTVLAVFLGLFPVGPAIPFYLMGMLVSTIQAFVFTLLSMVYIALATASDH